MNFLSELTEKLQDAKIDLFEQSKNDEFVIKISPSKISNWEFRDRQDFEIGNIDELAESIRLKGQAQPIIIVKSDENFKSIDGNITEYVVIAGYRRWLACSKHNLFIDAIVRKMSLEQAIACLVSENEREKVSDYSKGLFYKNILQAQNLKKIDLYGRLGISKTALDNYLAFNDIPQEILKKIQDISKISARTAATIRQIYHRDELHKQAIENIASRISGGIGANKIESLVKQYISKLNIENIVSNDTRVSFSDKIFVQYKKNKISLNLEGVSTAQYESIKKIINETLETLTKMN